MITSHKAINTRERDARANHTHWAFANHGIWDIINLWVSPSFPSLETTDYIDLEIWTAPAILHN